MKPSEARSFAVDSIAGLKTRLPNPFSRFGTSQSTSRRCKEKGHRMDIYVGNLPGEITDNDLRAGL